MKKKSVCFLVGLSLLLMSASADADYNAMDEMQPVENASAHSHHAHRKRPFVIDQMQPVVDTTVGGMAIGGGSAQQLAQTVTVGRDGKLVGLFLPIGCDSGRLVIEIRNVDGDSPGTVLLYRRRIDAAQLSPIGPAFRLFRIDPGLPLAAGDRLAVVLRNPTGSCGMFQGPVGDAYAGGEGFFQALPNPPGWVPFSDTETRLDLPFMTLMRLP
jgi:hypothetical protein